MLKFDGGEIEQRACTFNGNMITAPNGVTRLELAYAFRAAASRNHYGKSFRKPMRQSDISQLRNPALKVCVRQLMGNECGETVALSGKQNRRQDHMAQKCHADRTAIP